ncbi:MAG: PEP/pyruvate-binding domain-containing protein [Desulfobacteraceae bacterium]
MESNKFAGIFHDGPEMFQKLMKYSVKTILLISNPYNMFTLEEGGTLTSKIINEYSGLNLSSPPVITAVSSFKEAQGLLYKKEFDMVLIIPHLKDMDLLVAGREIKKIKPDLPVVILSPSVRAVSNIYREDISSCIDNIFIWAGNSDLLLALIKNAEDHLNVEEDTELANVSVVILLEDSPDYYSFFLPVIYREIVTQTEALLTKDLNDSLKLLKMRERPKILLAKNYEQALTFYDKFRANVLCVISDTRVPKKGIIDPSGGIALLSHIKKDRPSIPLLLMSSEPENQKKAHEIPCVFYNKNSVDFSHTLRFFFLNHLGFGDFVFCLPNGQQIDLAANLAQLKEKLPHIPDESVAYHADHDHFSRWLMARSEIDIALKFKSLKRSDFKDIEALKAFIIESIHDLRIQRHKGLVSRFKKKYYDPEIRAFAKIGSGSLGGKGRGLAFMSTLLSRNKQIHQENPEFNIIIPKTLVLSTDVFESFIEKNNLYCFAQNEFTVSEIVDNFLKAEFPRWLIKDLMVFLDRIRAPLAVRSSSQLEDAHFQPYAGLYKTYKIPNNHPDLFTRLSHLTNAIKLVYASTFYQDAKSFHRCISNKPFNDSMAVIVQVLAGAQYGDYYYPAISGVAQSNNYYPFSRMKAEDGIVHLALGLGKTVVNGEKNLRFSPKDPNILPQLSTIEDILKNTQTSFYALKTKNYPEGLNFRKHSNLEKLNLDDAQEDYPVKKLTSTYLPGENRIRDTWYAEGPKVLTFAHVLKYNDPPVAGLISDLLELGGSVFGGPVEIEFSVNLYEDRKRKPDFYVLQIRPMVAQEQQFEASITAEDIGAAFCYSSHALGNGVNETIQDIVYVKPDAFKHEKTVEMAGEVNEINAMLVREKRPYLLVGPGRWGASDRWLGIPVKWRNISGVGAIVELRNEKINADPSQGSHFFHNITSLGINYITIDEMHQQKKNKGPADFFDWEWIQSFAPFYETPFLCHVRLEKSMELKINGKTSQCVMIEKKDTEEKNPEEKDAEEKDPDEKDAEEKDTEEKILIEEQVW